MGKDPEMADRFEKGLGMAEISPRDEFRAFAQNFGMVETKDRNST